MNFFPIINKIRDANTLLTTAAAAAMMRAMSTPALGLSALYRQRLRRARHRSNAVRTVRSMIPGLIVALLGAALFLIVRSAQESRLSVAPGVADARILNPRFSGRDADGRGYTLSAISAARDENDQHIVNLDTPKLTRGDTQTDLITVSAPEGVYNETAETLVLRGGVKAIAANGYHFETYMTHVDINASIITGTHPISGVGPMGTMRGNAYRITQDGSRIVLSGGVRGRITQR